MTTFLLSFSAFALFAVCMSVGVLCGKKAVRGSCGGSIAEHVKERTQSQKQKDECPSVADSRLEEGMEHVDYSLQATTRNC